MKCQAGEAFSTDEE